MSMDNNFDDFDDTFEDDSGAPEESNNRTFLLIAGGLGLLVLCALLAVGAYLIFNLNSGQTTNEATAQAQATMQEMTVQAALTQTAIGQAQTQTSEATLAAPPTNTPVIAEATATATETPNPATATVGAAFTQIAASTQTIIPTSTALPNTGFADDVGIPGMFILAIGLVILIFFARRLRATSTQ
ncbi:MAG TPA: hypothetical protein DCX53_17185 [Anaerolineae bacterium]|nr:hypothetical protein [Anaerolineae bacterium]